MEVAIWLVLLALTAMVTANWAFREGREQANWIIENREAARREHLERMKQLEAVSRTLYSLTLKVAEASDMYVRISGREQEFQLLKELEESVSRTNEPASTT